MGACWGGCSVPQTRMGTCWGYQAGWPRAGVPVPSQFVCQRLHEVPGGWGGLRWRTGVSSTTRSLQSSR